MTTYLLTKSNEVYSLVGEEKTETGEIIYKVTEDEPTLYSLGEILVVHEDEVSVIDTNYSVILSKVRGNNYWKDRPELEGDIFGVDDFEKLMESFEAAMSRVTKK